MTFKEKLLQDRPDLKFAKPNSIGCPETYGYASKHADRWCDSTTCEECWGREMPEAKNKDLPHILDSGERRQFETGAVRDIQEGKGRCDLMPLEVVAHYFNDDILECLSAFMANGDTEKLYYALGQFCIRCYDDIDPTMFLEVAKHFEEGAKKYGENNWQKGLPVHCYIDSAVRHYLKWLRGDKDEPHDRAFVWNLMCCIWEVDFSPRAKEKGSAPNEEHKPGVAYICDRKQCGEKCPNPDCYHTNDIHHAENFADVGFGVFVEKCHTCKLIPATGNAELVRLGDYAGGIFEFADTTYVKIKLDHELENNVLCIDVLTGSVHTYSPDILVKPLDVWKVDGDEDE